MCSLFTAAKTSACNPDGNLATFEDVYWPIRNEGCKSWIHLITVGVKGYGYIVSGVSGDGVNCASAIFVSV